MESDLAAQGREDWEMSRNPRPSAWVAFFRKCNPDCNVPDDLMYTWFVNAMMAERHRVQEIISAEREWGGDLPDAAERIDSGDGPRLVSGWNADYNDADELIPYPETYTPSEGG